MIEHILLGLFFIYGIVMTFVAIKNNSIPNPLKLEPPKTTVREWTDEEWANLIIRQ